MPLLRRKSSLGAKVEATAGTPVVPGAADGAVNAYNWRLARNVPLNDRPGQGGFSNLASIHGPRMATATFETDLVGSGIDGTPPFWQAVLAVGCALTLTGDVLSCGTTGSTLTVVNYMDGIREGIAGAVGNGVITLTAGNPARIAWTFTGKLLGDADLALIVPTYPSTNPPRWAGNAVTVHGITALCSTSVLDFGNEPVMREDPADATGLIAGLIVDRKPTITIDPEAGLVATKDWQAIMEAHTEGSVSIACGTAGGNTITIASTTAQIIDPSLGERNKIVTRDLRLQLNSATPFQITQS